MNQPSASSPGKRPLVAPLILALISATHLAYALLVNLRGLPLLLPALYLALLLGAAYAAAAWLFRQGRGFAHVVSLIVGEDLGVLSAGLLLGYPWADYLRPGTVAIIGLQLALGFAEIWRRQEARQPIAPATRLTWFVLAYTLAFAFYVGLKPSGIWSLGAIPG